MAEISLKFEGEKASRLMQKLASAGDPPNLSKLIGFDYLRWINQNFKEGGKEKGWKDLMANTLAARRKGPKPSNSDQPLRDSGTLASSFIQGAQGNVFKVQPTQVTVGTQTKYASFHEEGTGPYTIRPKKAKMLRFVTVDGPVYSGMVRHPGLPQRKILPSNRLAERLAVNLIEAVLKKAGAT